MSFIEEILTLWETDGIGLYTGSNPTMFWGPSANIPEGDGPFVQINQTGGMAPIRIQEITNAAYLQQPSAQCIAIAADLTTAMTTARAMYNSLIKVKNTTLGGTAYVDIFIDQEPFEFPLDTVGRSRSGFNFRAVKEPS